MPEDIVYDQDHLITVSENAEDIILTGEFQSYKEQRGFRMYLCRKSDPESKVNIENVVKYVKYNFADSRKFTNIDYWNEWCFCMSETIKTLQDQFRHLRLSGQLSSLQFLGRPNRPSGLIGNLFKKLSGMSSRNVKKKVLKSE